MHDELLRELLHADDVDQLLHLSTRSDHRIERLRLQGNKIIMIKNFVVINFMMFINKNNL